MKPTMQSLRGGGSPFGFGYYDGILWCPRKAHLNRLYGKEEGYNKALDTGTIYHAFQERYRMKRSNPHFNASRVKLGGSAAKNEEARVIAERVFNAYRVNFPPDLLGTVVTQEEIIPAVRWNKKGIAHVTGPRAEAISRAVGAHPLPFTAKPDLVIHLNAKQAKRLSKMRRCKVTPGYWLVDFKTAGVLSAGLLKHYNASLQFKGYPIVWDTMYPKKKLQGVLLDIATKAKAPTFLLHRIDMPNKTTDVKILTSYFDAVRWVIDNIPNQTMPHRCSNYRGEICTHAPERSGKCTRF